MGVARLIELGWPGPEETLQAHAADAIFEAEQGEQSTLSVEEAVRVGVMVKSCLRALWNVREA
jgi:hypothetical protein